MLSAKKCKTFNSEHTITCIILLQVFTTKLLLIAKRRKKAITQKKKKKTCNEPYLCWGPVIIASEQKHKISGIKVHRWILKDMALCLILAGCTFFSWNYNSVLKNFSYKDIENIFIA